MKQQIKLSKTRELIALISLICVGYIVMHDMAFVPIYNNLYEEFGMYPMFAVNMVVSGGMLASTVAQLFVPSLLKKFSKKTLLSACGILYAVTAIGSGMIIDIVFMNVMLILCGIAQGVCTVCGAGLITDLYCEDEGRQGKIMGIYQALMSIFSVAISYIAGILAVNGWTNIFKVYWLAIPIALVFIFGVPNGIVPAEEILVNNEEMGQNVGEKQKLGKKFWLNAFSILAVDFMQVPAVLLISTYIAQHNIGNEAYAGLVSSAGTALGFVLTLLMGVIIEKTKKNSLSLFILLMTAGGIVLVISPSYVGCLVGSALCASAYSLIFAYGYILLPESVPVQRINTALVVAGIIGAIVIFLGTNVMAPIIESIGATTAITVGFAFCALALILQFFAKKAD